LQRSILAEELRQGLLGARKGPAVVVSRPGNLFLISFPHLAGGQGHEPKQPRGIPSRSVQVLLAGRASRQQVPHRQGTARRLIRPRNAPEERLEIVGRRMVFPHDALLSRFFVDLLGPTVHRAVGPRSVRCACLSLFRPSGYGQRVPQGSMHEPFRWTGCLPLLVAGLLATSPVNHCTAAPSHPLLITVCATGWRLLWGPVWPACARDRVKLNTTTTTTTTRKKERNMRKPPR